MFIEQVTNEQLYNFAQSLTVTFSEIPKDGWRISINKLPNCNHVRILIQASHFSNDYTIYFDVSDFTIQFWDVGCTNINVITTKFIQFMYNIFGEKYKEAFVKNITKPFDEVN